VLRLHLVLPQHDKPGIDSWEVQLVWPVPND
jgi:hypothetical protein